MIDEKKAQQLRRLVERSGHRFDFGGLPMPEIFDTLAALWKFKGAMKEMIEWSPRQMTVALMRREIRKALAALDDGKEEV